MPSDPTAFTSPAKTLQLLDALQESGFSDKAFAVVHHHKEPMTIEAHRRYCSMLAEDGDEFKTINNQLVQRRLEMVLTMYRGAGFTSGEQQVFVHLANAALIEVPHILRPNPEVADQSGGAP